jgi:hypothetical protein
MTIGLANLLHTKTMVLPELSLVPGDLLTLDGGEHGFLTGTSPLGGIFPSENQFKGAIAKKLQANAHIIAGILSDLLVEVRIAVQAADEFDAVAQRMREAIRLVRTELSGTGWKLTESGDVTPDWNINIMNMLNGEQRNRAKAESVSTFLGRILKLVTEADLKASRVIERSTARLKTCLAK